MSLNIFSQQKMLCDLSSLQAEALSHHMAALHSKDNPQGSPALLLVQLLFMPHLLENIWENERFGKFLSPVLGMQLLDSHSNDNIIIVTLQLIVNSNIFWIPLGHFFLSSYDCPSAHIFLSFPGVSILRNVIVARLH